MRRIFHLLCCVAVLGACNSDDDYDPTVPTDMALVKGNGQAGDAGAALPSPSLSSSGTSRVIRSRASRSNGWSSPAGAR